MSNKSLNLGYDLAHGQYEEEFLILDRKLNMSVFRNEWSMDGRKPEGYHHRMDKNLFEEKELDAEWINHLKAIPEKC